MNQNFIIDNSILRILSSVEMMLISTVIITVAAFFIIKKLIDNWKIKNYILAGVLCGIFNGVAAISINSLLENFYAIVPLLSAPVLLIVEIFLITREQKKTAYIILFFCIAINYVAFYDVFTSLLHLVHYNDSSLFEVGSYAYRNMLFSCTNLITGLIFFLIRVIKHFPREVLNTLIHNIRSGIMLAAYIIPTTIVLTITNVIFSPASNTIQFGEYEYILYINMVLKTLLVLFGAYLIIFIQSLQERLKEKSNILEQSLASEVAYRRSAQKNTLLYYRFNLTERIIDDHIGFFEKLDGFNEDGFRSVKGFLTFVCHPEDKALFENIDVDGFVEMAMADKESNVSHRFRLSPQKLLSVIDFKSKDIDSYNRLKSYETEYIWALISMDASLDEYTGNIISHVTIVDIDQLVSNENVLREEALRDQLTGMYNRKGAGELIAKKFEHRKSGALFMLDLDKFKDINDTFGHPEGDKLLITMAGRINDFFRGDDVICRLGGDEFLIFVSGLSDPHIISARARELNSRLTELYTDKNGKRIAVTASIGIAITPKDATELSALYECADKALYHAKEAGRNTFRLYEG